MSKLKALITIGATAALAASVAFAAAPATAAPAASKPSAVSNSGDGYVIINAQEGVKGANGSTFYPTGPLGNDTLVVIAEPDGSLPNGLTESTLKALTTERKVQRAVANPDAVASPMAGTLYAYAATSAGWSGDYTGGSHIGTDWSARIQYNFWAAAGSSQTNVGQGLGYYQGYNGGSFGVWSQWYNLGSATSSGGGTNVPWGNVAAVAKFHAKCATTTACGGYFQN